MLYEVGWKWRHSEGPVLYDSLNATDAQRALNKLKKQLGQEYSDIGKLFVPVSVVPIDA